MSRGWSGSRWRMGRLRERAVSVGVFAVVLALWEGLVAAGALNRVFFPPPSAVAQEAVAMLRTGELQGHVAISLYRILAGFAIGAIPGVVLGAAIGTNRLARAAVDPLIAALYPLPKIAILPLILILFGLGEGSKIAIVAVGAFFPAVINAITAVRTIEPILLDAGRNFGANPVQMFWHVILPGSLPIVFAGLRLSLGTALVVIIAAEFVAAKAGLGYLIWTSWSTLVTEPMFVGLVVIALLGLLFTGAINAIEWLTVPWRREQAEADAEAQVTAGQG